MLGLWRGEGALDRGETFEEVPLKNRKLVVCSEKPMVSNLQEDLEGD